MKFKLPTAKKGARMAYRHVSPKSRYPNIRVVEIVDPEEFEEKFITAMKGEAKVEDADDADIREDGCIDNPKSGFIVFEPQGPVWYWIDFFTYGRHLTE